MATNNAINTGKPIEVSNGGTGASTLTQYGVLVGDSTSAVSGITAGSTGELLVATTSANPAFATSAAGDFSFTDATAGATRTLTVSNTDNSNTASSAVILAQTGGASSGDAVHQASTTTTTWSWGIDNSVTSPTADPFVIAQGTALGTNNAMSISTGGIINYPLQPAFSATNSLALTNVTGDGTIYGPIAFNTTSINVGNCYNTGTYTFTAPVTGSYQFNIKVTLGGLGTLFTLGNLWLVTTARQYEYDFGPLYVQATFNHQGSLGFSCLADMAEGNTAYVQIYVYGSTKTVSIPAAGSAPTNWFSHFSGYLVG
jgi:hypothetical protein